MAELTDFESVVERLGKVESKLETFEVFNQKFVLKMTERYNALTKSSDSFLANTTFEELQKTPDYANFISLDVAAETLKDTILDYVMCLDNYSLINLLTNNAINEKKLKDILYGLNRIEDSKVEFEYVAGYWDGPLSGMATINKKRYWIEILCESYHLGPNIKVFIVYKLNDNQYIEMDKSYNMFSKYVSSVRDYRLPESERNVKTLEESQKYYTSDLSKYKIDLSIAEKIAWFCY